MLYKKHSIIIGILALLAVVPASNASAQVIDKRKLSQGSKIPVPRPPLDPSAEKSVQNKLSRILRVNGRTGTVDLRGRSPAVAEVSWHLSAPESDNAIIIVTRTADGRCPSRGTSADSAYEQLNSDRAVIHYEALLFPSGKTSQAFSAPRWEEGLRLVHVLACGVKRGVLNGIASNTVGVQIGSVNPSVILSVDRWLVEWSLAESSNAACSFGVDTTTLEPPPRPAPVGYKSAITRGRGPVPCVRDRLYRYQASAGFDVSSLPRGARIVRAELRFSEINVERHSTSGRQCISATHSVGLATSPVQSGVRKVARVPGSAADARRVTGGSTRTQLTVNVIDWVRAWQRGRAADLIFLGHAGQHGGSVCRAVLSGVQIYVEHQ